VEWDAAVEVILIHIPVPEKRMRRRNYIAIKKPGVIAMAKDPICGMEVSEAHAAATLEYRGRSSASAPHRATRSLKKIRTTIFHAKRRGGGTGS
jgi:hypothetical protein